jgi:hypothetical protein
MTEEEKKDVKQFRRGATEDRAAIAEKYEAEEDYKRWEDEINAKQVEKGMSKSAVLMSWGRPNGVEVSEDGQREKWFYRRSYDWSYTLFFQGDKLESWRSRKFDRSR